MNPIERQLASRGDMLLCLVEGLQKSGMNMTILAADGMSRLTFQETSQIVSLFMEEDWLAFRSSLNIEGAPHYCLVRSRLSVARWKQLAEKFSIEFNQFAA